MKKKILLFATFVFALSLIGCTYKKVENTANEVAEVFSSGDMESINHLVFGISGAEMDSETKELLEVEEPQGGVMEVIFSHTKVFANKVKKDTVEFSIIAPDMEKVFEELPENSLEFTEEDLLVYIKNYIDDTKAKKFLISVPYTVEGENVIIDYQNPEFLNAVSGGLFEAYKKLYFEALDKY